VSVRNVAERLVNRLKQFRRIATRYEKRAVNARHDRSHRLQIERLE
jgi:transposase